MSHKTQRFFKARSVVLVSVIPASRRGFGTELLLNKYLISEWTNHGIGGILTAHLRERIISLITKTNKQNHTQKKQKTPRLKAPIPILKSRPQPCLEAKGSLLATHSTWGGPVSGQSLILNDTLTLLHYLGVILITKGFNCLSVFLGAFPLLQLVMWKLVSIFTIWLSSFQSCRDPSS